MGPRIKLRDSKQSLFVNTPHDLSKVRKSVKQILKPINTKGKITITAEGGS